MAHDCNIGKSVVLVNGALLGGHVSIGSNVLSRWSGTASIY